MHDSATLSGATADASGTAKYAYYSVLANCQAGTFATPGGTSAGSKTVAAGSVPNSDDVTLAAGSSDDRTSERDALKDHPAPRLRADEDVTVTNTRSISTTLPAAR